jgi:hypothetical protein
MEFNNMCIQTTDLLLFHDFSGRDTWKLADYFDPHCLNHLDRIVYDLTLRREGSCAIDLNDSMYFLPISNNEKYTSLVNPYMFSNYDISNINENCTDDKFKSQLNVVIRKRCFILKNHVYPLLRRFINHKRDIINDDPSANYFFERVNKDEFYIINIISDKKMYEIYQNYEQNREMENLDKIIEMLKQILRNYVVKIMFFAGDDEKSIETQVISLMNKIEDNIYNWTTLVINYLDDKLQNRNIVDNNNMPIHNFL